MRKLALIACTAAISTSMWGCFDSSAEATPNAENGSASNPAYSEAENTEASVSSSAEQNAYSSSENAEVDPLASSSSSETVVAYNSCGDMWCVANHDYDKYAYVLTGYTDQYETAGWWYDYTDEIALPKGNSSIFFPLFEYPLTYGNFYSPLVEQLGGIKASVQIGDAIESPYAGFAFNIVNEDWEGADITDWKGICLAYSSTAPFTIDLHESDEANTTEGNYFTYTVPKSENLTVVNASWSEFNKSSAYNMLYDMESFLKSVAAVKLNFTESSEFFLTEVGRYGTCGATTVSSSSAASSSSGYVSTTKYVSEQAYWDHDEGRIITGSDEETAGYWYDYNDNDVPKNGNSKMTFHNDTVSSCPTVAEDSEYGHFYCPTVVYDNSSIKATVEIGDAYESPFVGLGFNVWSENQEGADITQWEGVCITYTSTMDFAIEIEPENEESVTGGNNYKAVIPKAEESSVLLLPWSMFKQETGWGVSAEQENVLQKAAAVKFKFTSSGNFFLTEFTSGNKNCGVSEN